MPACGWVGGGVGCLYNARVAASPGKHAVLYNGGACNYREQCDVLVDLLDEVQVAVGENAIAIGTILCTSLTAPLSTTATPAG